MEKRMSYVPKSEEQLAKEGLLPDGIYDFEVVETSDKKSSKGNAMYTLKLHIFGEDGSPRIIFDYIALGNNFGERKLRHAADAAGIIHIYETGEMKPSDFQGKTGKVEIKTQEGTPDYPLPKNVVKDYVKRPLVESVATGAIPSTKDILDGDECPF